jgi:metal-responsive CopG/Arc/MetJ family transcriptional regulator
MKTAISMPDALFQETDALARRLGVSRSELISKAVKRFVAAHRRSKVTEALNRVYATESSGADRAFERSLSDLLPDEGW